MFECSKYDSAQKIFSSTLFSCHFATRSSHCCCCLVINVGIVSFHKFSGLRNGNGANGFLLHVCIALNVYIEY